MTSKKKRSNVPPDADYESWNRHNLHCLQYYPHDNTVCIHMCDEFMKSIDFVTSFGPFRNRPCKFIHWPWNIRSSTSGRNLIHPSLQDSAILRNFFQYMYHIGCAFNLHSIINSGLTLGSARHRQCSSFLLILGQKSQGSWRDWLECVTSCTIHAKEHGRNIKTQCIGSTSILLWRKDWNSIKHAIILHARFPDYCIPKVVRMETGDVIYEKVSMSLRPPPKISLRHDWKRELGSERLRPTLSNPILANPFLFVVGVERTVRLVIRDDAKNLARWKRNFPFSGDRCWIFSRR